MGCREGNRQDHRRALPDHASAFLQVHARNKPVSRAPSDKWPAGDALLNDIADLTIGYRQASVPRDEARMPRLTCPPSCACLAAVPSWPTCSMKLPSWQSGETRPRSTTVRA